MELKCDSNCKDTQNTRHGGIELLRIVAMFAIVSSHYSYYLNCKLGSDELLSANRWFLALLSIGGTFGVDLFILISGYFHASKSNTFPLRRICRLHSAILFYSIIPFVVFSLCGGGKAHPAAWASLGTSPRLSAIFPVITNQWWFATDYFVLSMFSPFLDRLLQNLSRHDFSILIAVILGLFVALPTSFGHLLPEKSQWFENHLVWFFACYCIGDYLRRFEHVVACVKTWCLVAATTIGIAFVWFSLCFLSINFRGRQQLPIVVSTISCFILFKRIKMRNCSIAAKAAGTTFGIYLIHDHPLTRGFLWPFAENYMPATSSFSFIPWTALVISCVFFMSFAMETCRQIIFHGFGNLLSSNRL